MPINLPISPNSPLAKATPVNGALDKILGDALSGVVGTVASGVVTYLWDMLWGIPQDPDSAMLNSIAAQIGTVQTQIKNLPQATATYEGYSNAVTAIQSAVNNHTELLTMNNSYPDYNTYLASFNDLQWQQLAAFLTIDSGSDYFTLATNLLSATYGITVLDITNNSVQNIPYGNGVTTSYAGYYNTNTYYSTNAPIGLSAIMGDNGQICSAVLLSLSSLMGCAQLVLQAFQNINANTALMSKISAASQALITNRVTNAELVNYILPANSASPVPAAPLYQSLVPGIANAPYFYCGNALGVFNALTQGGQFYLKNVGNGQYINHGEPKGADVIDSIEGDCDYWTTAFTSSQVAHTASIQTIYGQVDEFWLQEVGCGDLYYGGFDLSYAPVNAPTSFIGDTHYPYWQIQLMLSGHVTTTPANFNFLINCNNGESLVNNAGTPDTESLQTSNNNFLWSVIPV